MFFTIHVISVKYTLISNYYKNRRILKHMYQRSLGKYTVSPGHSLIAHHKNAVDGDSDKNEDL